LLFLFILDRQHPSHSFFYKLGSFCNRGNANQQPRRKDTLDENIEIQVLAYERANPRVSTRHVGFEVGIYHNAVHKILK